MARFMPSGTGSSQRPLGGIRGKRRRMRQCTNASCFEAMVSVGAPALWISILQSSLDGVDYRGMPREATETIESELNLQVTSADTRYGVVTLWNTMPKKKAVWHLSYPWRLPSVQDVVMHKLIHKTCESIITPPGDDGLDKSRLYAGLLDFLKFDEVCSAGLTDSRSRQDDDAL